MASKAKIDDEYEISGINVTPLVDIMLVLLIIFMVTATYIVKEAIKIELPRASAPAESVARTLEIVVTKEGKTFLDGVDLSGDGLVRKLRALPGKREDVQAVVSADRGALHGMVVQVLDQLAQEGITKFAIQIERERKP
jgi:biopolymer transport protein TolR